MGTRSRPPRPVHSGFSLMEMILATAILAGSGAALFALIGTGSLYGRRAETRAEALRVAENLLAEAVASLASGQQQSDGTDAYTTDPRWTVTVTKQQNPLTEGLPLVCLAVEVAAPSNPEAPICRLVRWVRVPASSGPEQGIDAYGGT